MNITVTLGVPNYISLSKLFEVPIFKYAYEVERVHCDLDALEGFLSYVDIYLF